jgi:hypothetical protein
MRRTSRREDSFALRSRAPRSWLRRRSGNAVAIKEDGCSRGFLDELFRRGSSRKKSPAPKPASTPRRSQKARSAAGIKGRAQNLSGTWQDTAPKPPGLCSRTGADEAGEQNFKHYRHVWPPQKSDFPLPAGAVARVPLTRCVHCRCFRMPHRKQCQQHGHPFRVRCLQRSCRGGKAYMRTARPLKPRRRLV